jgi:hypothetical protein
MKKKILSQLMILSFAFAGLFLVGSNVFGQFIPLIGELPVTEEHSADETEQGGNNSTDCEMSVTCADNICIVLNASARWWSTDCKKRCDYTCNKIKLW